MGQNRVAELYDYLCEYKLVSSIKDFGDQTHIARSIASLLISGKTRLSEKYLQRICSTFSFVNPDWLRSGNGEMFNSPVPISEETLKQFEDDVARMAYFREEYEREQEDVNTLEEKAAAYDNQCLELKKAYEVISDIYSRLAQKEEQILKLTNSIIMYKERVRQLKSQISGLMKE